MGDKRGTDRGIAVVPGINLAFGHPYRAIVLWAAAKTFRNRHGPVLDPRIQQAVEAVAAKARAVLGEAAFQAARSEGKALSVEAAVAYALADDSSATA